MFCKKCGKEIKDGSAFCTGCGAPTNGQTTQPQSDVAQSAAPQSEALKDDSPQNGTSQGNTSQNAAQQSTTPAKPLGMGWFKYMIYFGLFGGAALNVVLGILSVTGATYGEYADAIYALIPGLRAVDIIYGVYLFIAAVLCIVVRFQLAAFKAKGIKMFIILYALNLGMFALFVIINLAMLSDYGIGFADIVGSQQIAWVVSTVVMLIISVIYLKRRRHMFV